MSIFDKLKSTAQQAATSAIQSIGNKREKFTFAAREPCRNAGAPRGEP